MALDNATQKQLNNIIKLLATAGNEVGNKSRELVTLMYAIQQGFIDVEDKMGTVLDDISRGKFEKKNFSSYLKTLGVTEDQLKIIKRVHKEIGKLTDDQIISAKDYGTILDDIVKSEDERYDISIRTITAFDQINKHIKNQKHLVNSVGVSFGENVGLIDKQIQKHNELSNSFNNEFLPTSEIEDHLATIREVIDNITASKIPIIGLGKLSPSDAIDVLNTISDEQIKLLQVEDKVRRQKLKAFAAEASGKKIKLDTGEIFGKDAFKPLSGAAFDKTNTMLERMADNYTSIVKQALEHGSLTDDMLSGLSAAERVGVKQLHTVMDTNAVYEKQLTLTKRNAKNLIKFRPALKAAQTASDELAASLGGVLDILPKGLQKILGIDNAVSDIQKSGSEAISVFKSKLIETGSASESVGTAIKTWGKGIGQSVGFLGGFVLLLGGLFKLTSSIEGNYKELAHQLHISNSQAKELYKSNLKLVASYKNQFLLQKDIVAAQEAYVHATGQVFSLTEKGGQKLIMALGEIGKSFGYGAETAVEIYEVFSQLGADKALANKLQTELGFMSEMAGLSPNIIAKDLIENADLVSTYFAGMPEMAARTVIQVRRMGMSLKQAGSIAEKMLNLEGFMSDMFELAAMGGADLSEAFDLGISGDIEGMTKSIMDSIGSLSEFEDMDFLQRKKLAQTLGMTTGELSKSLMLREKLAGMGEAEKVQVEANLDRMGNIAGMDQDAIKARLAQLNSTDRLAVAWDKIKATFIKALLPAAEAFADMLEGAAPLIDVIVGAFKVLGVVVKGVAYFVGGMVQPLKWIGNLVGKIMKLFKGTENSAKSTSSSISVVGDHMSEFLKISGAAFAVWKLGGGQIIKFLLTKVGLLGKASSMMGGLGKMGTKVGGIFSKIKMPSIGGATSKGGGIVGKVTGMLGGGKSGGGSSDGTSTIGGGVADNVTNFGEKLKKSGTSIKSGFDNIGKIIKNGITFIKDVVGGLVDIILEPIRRMASGLGDVIKSILTGIGDGLESFGSNALKGAASMIILSGALWITSKAMQGFVDVKWGDVAKAGVSLLGLAGIAMLLGGAAANMIVGSAALAILGVALIPAAYALGLFSDISWTDLAQAGVGLLGLTAAVVGLGAIMMSGVGAVAIVAGAAALALMGAALIPFAMAISMLSDSNMTGIGEGLASISAGMAAIAMNGVVSLFSGDPFKQLKELAAIANPLDIVSKAISLLGDSIVRLSEALATADFDKLSEFEKLKGIAENVGIGFKMSRGEHDIIQPPSAESTAQNISVPEPPAPEATAQNVNIKEGSSEVESNSNTGAEQMRSAVASFGQGGSNKKIEMLLNQLVMEMRGLNRRPIMVDFGDGTLRTLNTKMKGLNNNR